MATSTAPRQSQTGLVGKAWEIQDSIEHRIDNLGKGKYGRVLKMARKPSPEEFEKVAKITMIGMIALGAIGFVIYYLADIAIPAVIDFLSNR